MRCRDLERVLIAHLEGTLTETGRLDLDAHLAGCPACRARWEAVQVAEVRLRRPVFVRPAPGFSARVMARLAQRPAIRSTPWPAQLIGLTFAILITDGILLSRGIGLVWGEGISLLDAARQSTSILWWLTLGMIQGMTILETLSGILGKVLYTLAISLSETMSDPVNFALLAMLTAASLPVTLLWARLVNSRAVISVNHWRF